MSIPTCSGRLFPGETFGKYSFLFKFKPPARRAYAPEGKTRILTTPMKNPSGQASIHLSISRIKI